MYLSLDQIKEEDQGIISPCGIVCLGCDSFQDESLKAAQTVVRIWRGMNLPDTSLAFNIEAEAITSTLETLEKIIEQREKAGPCPGCYKGGGPSEICSIARCVKSKDYWTCAECDDYDPESQEPCPQADSDAFPLPFASRGNMSTMISTRYCGNNRENLKRCREIGYPAFISEVKEKVENGWRTWQVISDEMVFSKSWGK